MVDTPGLEASPLCVDCAPAERHGRQVRISEGTVVALCNEHLARRLRRKARISKDVVFTGASTVLIAVAVIGVAGLWGIAPFNPNLSGSSSEPTWASLYRAGWTVVTGSPPGQHPDLTANLWAMAAPIIATLWTVTAQRSSAHDARSNSNAEDDVEVDLEQEARIARLSTVGDIQYVLCIAAAVIALLVIADLIHDRAPGAFMLAMSALVLWVWLVTELTRIGQAPDVMLWRRLQLRAIQADSTTKLRERAQDALPWRASLTVGAGLALMLIGTAIALAGDWSVMAIAGTLTAVCYAVMLTALVTSSDGYLREGRWGVLVVRIAFDVAFALGLVQLTLTALLVTGPEAWWGQPWRAAAGAGIQVATYGFLIAGVLGRGPARGLARFTLDAAARRDQRRRARLRA